MVGTRTGAGRGLLWVRAAYLAAALVVMATGLASRRYATALPPFLAAYAGDTLWALLVFLLVSLLFPTLGLKQRVACALLFAFLVELSQLYHAPWIDRLRSFTLGGLVLGFGFLWSDLVCYTVGIALGAGVDALTRWRGVPPREANSG